METSSLFKVSLTLFCIFPVHSSLDKEIMSTKFKNRHLILVLCFKVIFMYVLYKISEIANH